MAGLLIRDATEADYDAIVALNVAEVRHTSAMDVDRLRHLASLSDCLRVATLDGRVVAFLLAMRAGADYRNDNFGWFAGRYPDFLYVDRIVVDAAAQGHGLGSRLYADLFAFARERGIPRVTCEFNVVPPNEPSRLFHARHGFVEAGRQWLDNGRKQVSMQVAELA
ncbi:GNAT family N-acetyltransferase [Pseudoxanthomonas sp.]|uniref:GNAT family N-acetyltransferase n=1 Tax=Pseudoxanthomonas sp. TaxID=1871049 RepID=UPI0025F7F78B|nr:GNAT family N-acetyltransferase [Pseudoxanthomonas sp.]